MRHSEYYERPVDGADAGDVWMGERRLNQLYGGGDFFVGPQHSERVFQAPEEEEYRPTWRLKDRLKTSGVALVMCLNLGTDPPNVAKPNPCARKQCWFDPANATKQKGLEIIGNTLQQQYEKLQSKSKYKQCLDPTSDDLRRVCCNLRKQARGDRLLMHYNGHGVPRPTANGELWTFGKNYTFYMPVSVLDIKSWFGEPAIYVIDCSGAGVVLPFFVDSTKQSVSSSEAFGDKNVEHTVGSNLAIETSGSIVLAACKAEESLPLNPQYPADIFTSCLTTPISISARWFMINNPHSMSEISLDLAENIPGKESERKSPRGELYWIFTAITDTIAWSILPPHVFQKMFRQDLLVASLFRNFLLAKRLMKGMRCNPQSNPPLPDCSFHPLWQVWDFALETGLLNTAAELKGILRQEPQVAPWYVDVGVVAGGSGSSAYIDSASASLGGGGGPAGSAPVSVSAPFFADMLTAFEIWLDFGGGSLPPDNIGVGDDDDSLGQMSHFPVHLPIILQILLSQTYRVRALNLLLRYISKGAWAVNSALLVGIYPYIIKLLPAASAETRQSLVAIWTYIIAFDHSCRIELVKDKHHSNFISWLRIDTLSVPHRCMSAFVLCEICNSFREGQQVCLSSGLHKTINQLITQSDVLSSPVLKRWVSLILGKLCEDFVLAKYMFMSEVGHLQFHQLLVDACPLVRSAVVSSLGELFGASQGNLTQGNAAAPAPFLGTPLGGPIRHTSGFGGTGNMHPPFTADGSAMKIPHFPLGSGGMMPPPMPMSGIRMSPSMGAMGTPQHDFSSPPPGGAGEGSPHTSAYASRAAVEQLELRRSELQLALHILDRLNDGSAMVRREAVVALSKFLLLPMHWPCIKLVVRFIVDYHTRLLHKDYVSNAEQNEEQAKGDDTANTLRSTTAPIPVSGDGAPAPASSAANSAGPTKDQPGSGKAGSTQKSMSSYHLFPWLLPSAEHKALALEVENLLIEEGVLSILSGGTISKRSDADPQDTDVIGLFSVLSSLAASYMRLWLSLREVLYKDSHPRVVKSMGSVISYVHAQMSADDASVKDSEEWGVSTDGGSLTGISTPSRDKSPKLTIKTPNHSTSPLSSPIGSPSLPAYHSLCGDGNYGGKGIAPNNWLLLNNDTMTVAACMASDPCLQSSIYQWSRKLFLQPDTTTEEEGDPLSKRGQELLFKERQLNCAMMLAKRISNKYRVVESKTDRFSFDRRVTESSEPMGNTQNSNVLPSSLSNFQPKAIITVKNAEMSTHVLFHGYKDVLAVCDGEKVGLWSLENGSKLGSVDRKVVRNANLTAHYGNLETSAHLASAPTGSRITALHWLNQSNDSLMLTGADDGTVHIWRDNLGDDVPDSSDAEPSNTGGYSPNSKAASAALNASSGHNKITPSLAGAFTALPDIAASSRGSGMIADWQQHSGVLAVGGNSETIRLWDVNREQCARVLHTGTNKCTTAISSQSVAWKGPQEGFDLNQYSVCSSGRGDSSSVYWSWVFAGFGDGSVAVFDEKVPSQGGRVHSAREDKHWIVHAYVREDVPEVVVGALYGGVKFWDLRTMRVFKTIEVHKSPLTAMAIHNSAPIMATGSHKQFIKILTMGGDLLSMIRYHDGFLGQRIAPVSCLAFHPHKMLLAAGSTDQIVAIYAPTESFA